VLGCLGWRIWRLGVGEVGRVGGGCVSLCTDENLVSFSFCICLSILVLQRVGLEANAITHRPSWILWYLQFSAHICLYFREFRLTFCSAPCYA
jgi:hypothetical protein